MTTALEQPASHRVTRTASGWLAVSDEFPRIAVPGATEQEALAQLAERCAWWRGESVESGT